MRVFPRRFGFSVCALGQEYGAKAVAATGEIGPLEANRGFGPARPAAR